jgi:hypothetical protein
MFCTTKLIKLELITLLLLATWSQNHDGCHQQACCNQCISYILLLLLLLPAAAAACRIMMAAISKLVAVIPVIAKADTFTAQEMEDFRQELLQVRELNHNHNGISDEVKHR